MNEAPRLNIIELTVSELSMQLKRTVEDAFGYVRVRGELGNVKYHSSGHIYLDLKDDRACLAGIVWRTAAPRIKLRLEAGLEVVVTGRITTYPGQSKYQIVIETVEPAGLGALMALVEERKKKLAAEGLFDPARKQLLPFLPEVIGVVTSPTGAVIRDILHRLADRFPRRVLVWPVKVQGEGSANDVARAIRGFNALAPSHPSPASGGGMGGGIPRPDVLIVARGGGSLEDLWSFNEEIVVRAAAESMIPLISAVGHETDVTLIDFAADKRAPTPTAAAEMAVPVRAELIARLDGLARRNIGCWLRGQEARRGVLRAAARVLPDRDDLLAWPRQRLDAASERLPLALRANARLHHARLAQLGGHLRPALLLSRIAGERPRLRAAGERSANALRIAHTRRRERLTALTERGQRAADILLDRRFARLDAGAQLLAAFSYRGVLARGFALVRDGDGTPLRSAAAVSVGMALDIELSDGRVAAVAGDTRAVSPLSAPLRRRRRRTSNGDDGQGSLFS